MGWGKEEQRRERRRPVDLVGLAFRPDGSRSVVEVSDISFEGCQFTGDKFGPQEALRLVIPDRGEMDAKVRWASNGKIGACFDSAEGLEGAVSTRERKALNQIRSLNYGSGRVFGRRGLA
ncbi:hypothetical protein GCM10022276_14680 [Sphingomonas limnosediminicola]|jgi:hypothetical protein|uniref:PilZ domain-containing protein n=1 Tax=Sphingomonas limnosediminicola TaxID=940133 RepID=A0ABP7LCD8_9SPHN